MGSVVMEPDELVSFAGQLNASLKNFTTICMSMGKAHSRGFLGSKHPLSYAVPLLLLQMSLASGSILFISVLLKPLGQPLVVRQLLGGIILGPSLLGRIHTFSKWVFPLRGFIMLDAVSSFGFTFYIFLIGLQTDPWILKRVERKAYVLGFFSVAVPLVLSTASCFFVMHHFNVDQNIAKSLPVVAQSDSVLSFPIVAQFLTELKIINSEFGRLALFSSMIGWLCSLSVITSTVLWQQSPGDNYEAIQTIFNSVVLGIVIIFVIRPAVMWMIKRNPEGEPLKQNYVIWLLLAVLMTGFFSQALSLHIYFGPLILGIVIPAEPPMGSTLVGKLDLIVSWIFMPIYLAKNGLVINIFSVKFKNFLVVQSISLVGAFGKFLGAFLVSFCCHMPVNDAASIGLVMNARGVLELGMLKMMKKNKAIDTDAYAIMCISMVLVAAVITPIIKYLYDPSKRYMVYSKRTMMNAKLNSELRVLVCIHDQENVPAAINLLEALNPTTRSPLSVFVLHLVELVGPANPLLIPHKQTERSSKKAKTSDPVVNAFRYFERSTNGFVTVFPFTAISPPKSMHDDVCTIALDNRTSLIVVPFYNRFQATSAVDSSKRAIKITNNNVLGQAPCSIAILVDRGFVNTSKPALNRRSSYRVAVLFLGGTDDREAVAIAARMAGHHKINLTIIRLLENGSISCDNTNEKRLDNEMLSVFRTAMATNYRVMYVEEVVMDAAGTISVIRSMENNFELVIVGRNHDNRSALVSGLMDCNEHKELGIIGDVLASSHFMGNTTILVVQQHTNTVNEGHENSRRSFRFGDQVNEKTAYMPLQRRCTKV